MICDNLPRESVFRQSVCESQGKRGMDIELQRNLVVHQPEQWPLADADSAASVAVPEFLLCRKLLLPTDQMARTVSGAGASAAGCG